MLPVKGIIDTEGVSLLHEVAEPPSEVIKLLEVIANNTAVVADASTVPVLPEPVPIDLAPLVSAIQENKPVAAPVVSEWHFEIKRNQLNLITDVVARSKVNGDY